MFGSTRSNKPRKGKKGGYSERSFCSENILINKCLWVLLAHSCWDRGSGLWSHMKQPACRMSRRTRPKTAREGEQPFDGKKRGLHFYILEADKPYFIKYSPIKQIENFFNLRNDAISQRFTENWTNLCETFDQEKPMRDFRVQFSFRTAYCLMCTAWAGSFQTLTKRRKIRNVRPDKVY